MSVDIIHAAAVSTFPSVLRNNNPHLSVYAALYLSASGYFGGFHIWVTMTHGCLHVLSPLLSPLLGGALDMGLQDDTVNRSDSLRRSPASLYSQRWALRAHQCLLFLLVILLGVRGFSLFVFAFPPMGRAADQLSSWHMLIDHSRIFFGDGSKSFACFQM